MATSETKGGGSRGGRTGGGGGGGVVSSPSEAKGELDKKQYQTLINSQLGADLEWYLQDGFLEINQALREGNVSPHMQKQIENIDKALDKLPSYRGVVYRQVPLPRERLDRIAASLVPGKNKISEDAYASSSASRFIGKGLATLNLRIQATGKNGKAIFQLGKNPHEQEVLFRRGTEFRVLSVKRGKYGSVDIDVAEL